MIESLIKMAATIEASTQNRSDFFNIVTDPTRAQKYLFRTTSRMLWRTQDAEDAAQQTLLQILERGNSEISKNDLIELARKQSRRVVRANIRANSGTVSVDYADTKHAHGTEQNHPQNAAITREFTQSTQSTLYGLLSPETVILLLGLYRGFTYEEMAAKFGIKLGTVKSRISLARGKLKKAPLLRSIHDEYL